jgi:hypothetical protein
MILQYQMHLIRYLVFMIFKLELAGLTLWLEYSEFQVVENVGDHWYWIRLQVLLSKIQNWKC